MNKFPIFALVSINVFLKYKFFSLDFKESKYFDIFMKLLFKSIFLASINDITFSYIKIILIILISFFFLVE